MKKDTIIKALVMDVDGTLTDGSLYIGTNGEVMKRFYAKDGYAIKKLLPSMEILSIILTGRESEIVCNRCRELDISCVIQGSDNKLFDLTKVLNENNISLEETAYIGDDLNDLDCMRKVAVTGCPNDAAREIREISDYVAKSPGGYGAVREFIEWLKHISKK